MGPTLPLTVSPEAEAAQVVAQLLLARLGRQPRQVRQRRAVHVQHVELVLVEIADGQPARGAALAGLHRQLFGQRLDQRALAGAVGARRRGCRRAPSVSRRAGWARCCRPRRCSRRTGVPASAADPAPDRARNADIDAGLGLQRRQHLHARQGLDPALRLLGLGRLGLEAVDEALQAGGLALLAFVGDVAQAQALGALRQVVVVAAAVATSLAWSKCRMDFATASRNSVSWEISITVPG